MASIPAAVLAEFEADLDEYMAEWTDGVEEHVEDLEDEGEKSLDDLDNPELWEAFVSEMRAWATPVFRAIFDTGVEAAATMEAHGEKATRRRRVRELPTLAIDLDTVNEVADAAIADYVNSWVIRMQGSTQRQLLDAILRARRDGTGIEGVLPTAERLFGKDRGSTIAITETTNLFGFGLQAGYEAAGVTEWTWQTVQDAHVDPICVSRNGERYPISEQFEAAHPRCRCFPRPVLETMAQKSLLRRLADGFKFNPNHDPRNGQFTSGSGLHPSLRSDKLRKVDTLPFEAPAWVSPNGAIYAVKGGVHYIATKGPYDKKMSQMEQLINDGWARVREARPPQPLYIEIKNPGLAKAIARKSSNPQVSIEWTRMGRTQHWGGSREDFLRETDFRTKELDEDEGEKYSASQPRDRRGRWTDGPTSASMAVLNDAGRGISSRVAEDDLDNLLDVAAENDPVNLAKVQVTGKGNQNLFGRSITNRSRAEMPQIGKDMDAFGDYLTERGVKFKTRTVDPRSIRATQNELNSRAVGQLYSYMKKNNGKLPGDVDTLVVSKDMGVLDGHHRWAAAAGYSATQRRINVEILQANVPMRTLLRHAEGFAKSEGIASRGFNARFAKPGSTAAAVKELSAWSRVAVDDDEEYGFKYNPSQPRDRRGRWSDAGGYVSITPDSEEEKALYSALNEVMDLPLTEDPVTRRPEGPRVAVLAYKGRSKEMNGYLRGTYRSGLPGESRTRTELEMLDVRATSNVNWENRVRDMDGAFVNSPMPRNVVLHRGVSGNFLDSVKVGGIIRDPAYVSTSTSRDVAINRFTQLRAVGDDRRLVRLRVPKGVPAFAADGSEHEIILPRNTSMRMNGIRREGGFRVYDMEVVSVG